MRTWGWHSVTTVQHGGNTLLNPVPVPDPCPSPGPKAVPVVVKEKGIAKGERKTAKPVESEVAVMLSDMKAFLVIPEKPAKIQFPTMPERGCSSKKCSYVTLTRMKY